MIGIIHMIIAKVKFVVNIEVTVKFCGSSAMTLYVNSMNIRAENV